MSGTCQASGTATCCRCFAIPRHTTPAMPIPSCLGYAGTVCLLAITPGHVINIVALPPPLLSLRERDAYREPAYMARARSRPCCYGAKICEGRAAAAAQRGERKRHVTTMTNTAFNAAFTIRRHAYAAYYTNIITPRYAIALINTSRIRQSSNSCAAA